VVASHVKEMKDPVAWLAWTGTVLALPTAHNARDERRPNLDMRHRGTYSCAIDRRLGMDRDLRTVALSTERLLAVTRV